MKTEKTKLSKVEGRREKLHKYYKEVKTCALCKKEFGTDREKFTNICHSCTRRNPENRI